MLFRCYYLKTDFPTLKKKGYFRSLQFIIIKKNQTKHTHAHRLQTPKSYIDVTFWYIPVPSPPPPPTKEIIVCPLWSRDLRKYLNARDIACACPAFLLTEASTHSHCCKHNNAIHRPTAWANITILFTFVCIYLWQLSLFPSVERWVARIKGCSMSLIKNRISQIVCLDFFLTSVNTS